MEHLQCISHIPLVLRRACKAYFGSLFVLIFPLCPALGQIAENPRDEMSELRKLAFLIQGQQRVLSETNKDLAAAKSFSPSVEAVLKQTSKELAELATKQIRLIGEPKVPFCSFCGKVEVGIETVQNGQKVIKYADSYLSMIQSAEKNSALIRHLETRKSSAENNLASAYAAIMIAMIGLDQSRIPDALNILQRIDENARSLGLRSVYYIQPERVRPQPSSPTSSPGIRQSPVKSEDDYEGSRGYNNDGSSSSSMGGSGNIGSGASFDGPSESASSSQSSRGDQSPRGSDRDDATGGDRKGSDSSGQQQSISVDVPRI